MNILNELETTARILDNHNNYGVRCSIGGVVVNQPDFDSEKDAKLALRFACKVAAAANYIGTGATAAHDRQSLQRNALVNSMNILLA